MEKDKVIFCRPFHCPICDDLNRPVSTYHFAVFGETHQEMFVRKAKFSGKRGITPHIIMYDGKHDSTHKEILVVCGIVGCGIKLYESQDTDYPYDISFTKVRLYKVTNADFYALLDFKDITYKID